MTLTIIDNIEQGSDEWYEARRGLVTASVVGRLITPKTVQVASNVESRALTAELVAERLTGWTDDNYVSFDMARGHEVEPIARDVYGKNYAPVTEAAFMIRDDWGYSIGYSPDGLVADDGLIEIKSRRPKEHLATILAGTVPLENIAQCQAGLLVSGRAWLDYVSFCGGMPLWTKRVYPDPKWATTILSAVQEFEAAAESMSDAYRKATAGLPMTDRLPVYEEMKVA